jgi:hypothetical protein
MYANIVVMNCRLVFYFVVFSFFCSCIATKNSNYHFNQKYDAVAIREDIITLKKVVEANHPSLYWHTPKDSLNFYFDSILYTIQDSLTETQVKNKVAAALNKIKCGHTSVRFSKQFLQLAEKYKYPQFPLSIKVWQDSMVVLGRYNKEDTMLKRGTIITSINKISSKEIIQNITTYIHTDGNSLNFKYQILSNNFPAWYKNIYGLDSFYTIGYLDSNQQEIFTTIKVFNPTKDSTEKKEKMLVKKLSRAEKLERIRSLNIDTTHQTAFIRLTSFSNGKLRKFFRQSFKTIKENNIKYLVVDLRENGGGSVDKSVLLSKYLKDTAFKIGDTIAATTRNLAYKKHIKNGWLYSLMMQLGAKKMEDGLFHNRRYETHYFSPKNNHHFDGQVYLIQGGYTFSAATMFISSLYHQQNITIVGEETGGGFYGNSAMLLPQIILPNTKLNVRLPLFKLVMDKTRPKGRGIMPDFYISPSSDAIKKGVDLKLEKIKSLIQEKKIVEFGETATSK